MTDTAVLSRDALLYGGRRRRQREKATRTGLYALLGTLVIGVAAVADWALIQRSFANVQIALAMFPEVLFIAARNTILYTVLAYAFGLVLGLALAMMKLSTIGPYRWIATVYVEIFRGLPALLTLIFVFYGLRIGLGVSVPGGLVGTIAVGLGIVAAAYIAEILRAGIQAVPKGQMEAARSLGMSHGRAMATIVIPQAFRIVVPPLTNELVLLIKDTSLVFVLGTTPLTKELTKFGRDLMQPTGNATPLIVVGLVYLAITIPMTRLVAVLERRFAQAR